MRLIFRTFVPFARDYRVTNLLNHAGTKLQIRARERIQATVFGAKGYFHYPLLTQTENSMSHIFAFFT